MEVKQEYNVEQIRKDFPALAQKIHGKPLVFLDSGASAQKPQIVIDAVTEAYTNNYANIHRGSYTLSENASCAYEDTREIIAKYLNAKESREIIFTKGTTESINLVANSLSQFYFKKGDEIIISQMEHHANIVPWQVLVKSHGIKLKVIPIDHKGTLQLNEYKKLFTARTKLVAVTHCSNVLGTVNPIKEMAKIAHRHDVPLLADGAQQIVHQKVDVEDLDCDFYVFSSHKLYGPTGVGVLYAKYEWLKKMPPYETGGGMIQYVEFSNIIYADVPQKFEAGTPDIVGVIAFKKAIEYIQQIGMCNIIAHEHKLLEYATEKLSTIDGLKIIGNAKNKAAVITFLIEGYHSNDLGTLMDLSAVAVRAGSHCTHPLLDYYETTSTVRASFALYNTLAEVDCLYESIIKAMKMLD